MATDENGKLVFVSHSSLDTWIARQIAREISSRGAQPFLDEDDVAVGADFEEDILAFLERATELVALFTPWSMTRPYVWAEIGAAWIRRIPIVVVLHGITPTEFQTQPSAPVFLKRRDILPLNEIDSYFDQLSLRVDSATQEMSQ